MGALSRDGRTWTPDYLLDIDAETCIGCGRCFKVCGRGVMSLRGVTEDGDLVDPEEDDIERKVMSLVDAGACIGCGACARVCPKNCQSHGDRPM
ncbi:ferredoxin III, nif-specific [Telmatospirillum siberiense]|uniref:Ferredoxin III n=1 Tax=Telmatospirillum siberiense TaxID=382514 RepID=A0A2N3PVX4_9PROT|nr:ferredoxin III, nif-specific [Telmatospirillum siberiense]PKU24541.1 ferredoxin III, nif-specific [Telmatospirillum siberiense]